MRVKSGVFAAGCGAAGLAVVLLAGIDRTQPPGQPGISRAPADAAWESLSGRGSVGLAQTATDTGEAGTSPGGGFAQEAFFARKLRDIVGERDYIAAAQDEYDDEWDDFVSQLDVSEAEKRQIKNRIVMHNAHNSELRGQRRDGLVSDEAYDANILRDADLEEALDAFLSPEQLDGFRANLQRMDDEFDAKMLGHQNADLANEYTGILYFSRMNDLPTVLAYIASGADVNAMPLDGSATPLQNASRNGNLEMVEALIGAGADVDAMPLDGSTTPLHIASKYGHLEVVEALIGAGADVNAVLAGARKRSPLHEAAFSGNIEVVRALVAAGGDIDYADPESVRSTALREAAIWGNNEAVAELLSLGADATGEAGKYALYYAIHFERPDIERALLDAGADGNDPLVVAARNFRQNRKSPSN